MTRVTVPVAGVMLHCGGARDLPGPGLDRHGLGRAQGVDGKRSSRGARCAKFLEC